MFNPRIFGADHTDGETIEFVIYQGKSRIGHIHRVGRFFRATIGPGTGTGITPNAAAANAWQNFQMFEAPKPRITLRSNDDGYDMLVDGRRAGRVRKEDEGFLASVGGVERAGSCPMSAARLSWIKSLN